jgi:DNA polymerase/3'-5' exonuclease PolX
MIACLQALHRRLDIRFFPANCFWCAVLYFTGDSFVNTEMRRIAIEKGMKLSEYCLSCDNGDGAALPVHREEDVYEHLGLEYVVPTKRNSSMTYFVLRGGCR